MLIALAITACIAPALTTPEPSLPTPETTLTEPQSQVSTDAGTIETALGTFSWQRLAGEIDALPQPDGGLVVTSSGYAAIDHLWDPVSVDLGLQYWHSSDGYVWAPESFPVPVEAEYGSLQELGGGYWLTTVNPASVWRSDDGEAWSAVPIPDGVEPGIPPLHDVAGTIWLTSRNPPARVWSIDDETAVVIDTAAIGPPDIGGVNWRLEDWTWSGGPATVGEITVFPWDLIGSPDYGALGFGDLYTVWEPDTRTMGFWDGGRAPVETLSVEADGNRFIFIDETGSVVHEITINDDQLDPATLFDSPTFGNFRQLSLGVLDGKGLVTESIPPWGGFDSQSDVKLLGDDGRFLAYVQQRDQTGAVSTVELWTSTDGLTWSGPQRPGFMPENGPIDYIFAIRAEGDVVLAELGVRGHTEVWGSNDGISWANTGLSHDMNVLPWSLKPFGSGGIYIGNTTTDYEMFVSADLRTWESVDTSQLGMRPFPEGSGGRLLGAYTAGEAIFITLEEDATGTRDMWVLELDR